MKVSEDDFEVRSRSQINESMKFKEEHLLHSLLFSILGNVTIPKEELIAQ